MDENLDRQRRQHRKRSRQNEPGGGDDRTGLPDPSVSFTEAIRKEEVRPLHPLLMAHTLASMLMLGNREAANDIQPSPRELARDIIEMFWNGVGMEPKPRTGEPK
ncbi:hypothetical protein J21TS3_34430 [Paenibacillus cookii]|uniref:TetR family transcriptional regulator n=2 Tax=Paenibacillus cookii TaxID=157839 RepID=A0ABQ4LZD2_9BACL|nr:hypothetical protein J21TS3_34430 [Paenibacillus cookii]